MLMLSSPLCWLSKAWVNDGNTSHRVKKKEGLKYCSSFFITLTWQKHKSNLSWSVFTLKPSPDSINARVTPINTCYLCSLRAPQVLWDVSDPPNGPNHLRTITHQGSSWAFSNVLSDRRAWPLRTSIAPLGSALCSSRCLSSWKCFSGLIYWTWTRAYSRFPFGS